MTNPFDWKNYTPTISMADIERARKSAYQQTRVVNENRKKGVELFSSCAARAGAYTGGVPKDYATEMPIMPLHKRTIAKKRREGK